MRVFHTKQVECTVTGALYDPVRRTERSTEPRPEEEQDEVSKL